MANNEIKDVPTEDVGNQVQQLVDSDSVVTVTCTKQTNGGWTITARVP